MDELFEVLTLMQTHKVAQLPIILVGKSFWESTVNFDLMMDCLLYTSPSPRD